MDGRLLPSHATVTASEHALSEKQINATFFGAKKLLFSSLTHVLMLLHFYLLRTNKGNIVQCRYISNVHAVNCSRCSRFFFEFQLFHYFHRTRFISSVISFRVYSYKLYWNIHLLCIRFLKRKVVCLFLEQLGRSYVRQFHQLQR